jgi:hypothetical protein
MVLVAAAAIASPSFAEVVVFQGARLIDGTGRAPQRDAVLVIDGDRVAAVGAAGKVKAPPGARVIDAKGRTIVPGLINAHGHAGLVVAGQNRADGYTRENVQAQLVRYEQYGVTSVLTLGLNRDLVYGLRDEQRGGNLPGASLFTAGRGIGVPDARERRNARRFGPGNAGEGKARRSPRPGGGSAGGHPEHAEARVHLERRAGGPSRSRDGQRALTVRRRRRLPARAEDRGPS